MANEFTNKRVFVAMSGGVDSSVAALLLKKAGCQVTGITMNLGPRPLCAGSCCGLDAADDARRVCWHLDIPHYVFNYREAFNRLVIEPFCDEYLQGRTPNPCMRCNELIKFGLLLRQCRAMGADYLATGHYTRIVNSPSGHFHLLKGADQDKDQSYFLCGLTQTELPHVLFPLGDYNKPAIRQIAAKAGLPVAAKVDSQEICFIGEESYSGFVSMRLPGAVRTGPVRHINGSILGWHKGIHKYTIGQRRGLGIANSKALYVVKIDAAASTVWVAGEENLWSSCLRASDMTLVRPVDNLSGREVEARIRYRARSARARVARVQGQNFELEFAEPQRAVTPGQTVALYLGDEVIGGGLIC